MTCEYMAQQEGVLCEEVLLLSESNDDVCVKVKVHARVMGKVHEHVQLTLDGLKCHILFFCYGLKRIFSFCAAALLWFFLFLDVFLFIAASFKIVDKVLRKTHNSNVFL